MPSRLKISQFAHIENVDLELGDLTVLVGPQGSGKSIALQLFKLAHDKYEIVSALRDAAEVFNEPAQFLDLYLGRGMGNGLKPNTAIEVDGKAVNITRIARSRRSSDIERVFYIPAQRAMLLVDGYSTPFKRLTPDTPTVARFFSEILFKFFGERRNKSLFPSQGGLGRTYRRLIDEAVYHGGVVLMGEPGGRYRLTLAFEDGTRLPYMTWTAGQRELSPLLFGLDHLTAARRKSQVDDVEWVVIEEPEMGLHPQALSVVLLLVLELMSLGYRVIISTHAILVLDVVFTLRTLAERTRTAPASLFDAFGIGKDNHTRRVLDAALGYTYKTFLLNFTDRDNRVVSKDISGLDPSSDDPLEAEWGGLTGFSSRFNRVLLSE